MDFNLTTIERVGLVIGSLGFIGFFMIAFNPDVIQTHWFALFAAFTIFALRVFNPILKMPERLGFLGFLGCLGFLGFISGLQFLHSLFSFFSFVALFAFLGYRRDSQNGNSKVGDRDGMKN